MDNVEKLYSQKSEDGAVISKTYVSCPKCNAINLPTPEDIASEVGEGKYYHLACWSCHEEFYT